MGYTDEEVADPATAAKLLAKDRDDWECVDPNKTIYVRPYKDSGRATASASTKSTPAPAAKPAPFEGMFELLRDGTYALTSYTGDGGSVTIPAVYQGKPVTAIGD